MEPSVHSASGEPARAGRPAQCGRIVGWLCTVAKHEAFALLARTRREIAGDDLPLVATASDLDDIVDARDALRLIAQLKPQQRLVLLLRAEGHSYKAICELTGRTYTWFISGATCRRRVFSEARALATCRRR